MQTLQKYFRAMAGAAILTAAMAGAPVLALAQGAAQTPPKGVQPAVPEKKITPAEYDLYNAAQVSLNNKDYAKAIAGLDAWKQKFPNSDYAADGKAAYVQAYAGAGQFAKAIDAAGELLSGDIDSLYPDPKGGPLVVVRVLVAVCQSALKLQNATPEELATVRKGAGLLLKYSRKAEGFSDDQWTQLHTGADPLARQALYIIAVTPGVEAYTKKDFDTAEAVFRSALKDYPDNAVVANYLASTLLGEYMAQKHPEKFPEALYLFARAASLDPTASGMDKTWQAGVAKSLTTLYTRFHGSDDGLPELKALAVKSPTPPEGFTVKTGAEVERDKQEAFAAAHPELAQWLATKKALTDGGEAYFKESMADAAMPKLKGKVLDGKPACNPKSLILALSDDKTPEVTLVLDTPVKGKPTVGVDITYDGAIAKAFTATPFNLTMEMEQAKIEGLEKGPCPPRPPVGKKAAPPAPKKQ